MVGLLTVAMIVRDEEVDLPRCLESIRQLGAVIDEVCIYDTGSRDATVSLATQWGARVERGLWEQDFSSARNRALSLVRTRWALILDADDRIFAKPDELVHAIREVERRRDADQWGIAIYVDDVRNGKRISTAPGSRMIQPCHAHYRNRLHEVVTLKDGRGAPKWAVVARDAARIEHVGYSDPPAERIVRNLSIGLLEVAEAREAADVDRLSEVLTHLGRTHLMGDRLDEAEVAWREVRGLESSSAYRTYAGEYLAERLLASERWYEAFELIKQLESERLDAHRVLWFKACALAGLGQKERALELLRAIEQPRTVFLDERPLAPVYALRARLASELGHSDEASAALLALLPYVRTSPDLIPKLLTAWGARTIELLVHVIVQNANLDLIAIADAFEIYGGPGRRVAELLRRAVTEVSQ